jgi:hypothetical protein
MVSDANSSRKSNNRRVRARTRHQRSGHSRSVDVQRLNRAAGQPGRTRDRTATGRPVGSSGIVMTSRTARAYEVERHQPERLSSPE